jgi:hypothetical protein
MLGRIVGLAMADGYSVLVKPLKEGEHMIHFRGVFGAPQNPNFVSEVTYYLIVLKEDDKHGDEYVQAAHGPIKKQSGERR